MESTRTALATLLLGSTFACGASAPAVAPERASGQSGLMGGTFAGQNACNPKNHERPFVIEWDGTDMSLLESVAAYDVVFASYKGCELKILDGCRDDSVKGRFGAYRPVEWTSGSVERIEVRNEGELFAKLPLGVASLGGRVRAGESFLMEYFVAGTRTSTRQSIGRKELAPVPACKEATHYVYAYNVGAFALGSQKSIKGDVGAGGPGGAAGAASSSDRSVEKRGGNLSACRGDSATEVSGCKTPIRLTLRPIDDGQGDLVAGPEAAPPDASLAGKIQAERTAATNAEGHLRAAEEKALAHDDTGALAEYDAHDQLEPDAAKHSTNPASKLSQPRAVALMKVGKCEAGRELYRKSLEKMGFPPASVDTVTSDTVARSCTGQQGITPREELVRAMKVLYEGRYRGGVDAKACQAAFATAKRLESQVKWQSDSDQDVMLLPERLADYPAGCFARAGDCKAAFAAFKERDARHRADAELRPDFDRKYTTCAGK